MSNKEEKTLSYLNERTWFRLLKVLYIFAFLVIAVIALFFVYLDNFPTREVVDEEKTIITCNYGNKKQFTAGDKGVYFGSSEFGSNNRITEGHAHEIRSLCDIDELDYILFYGVSDEKALFDVDPVIKTEGGVVSFLKYSIISFLIILIVFEVIKRCFYYIVTGRIVPRK